MLDGKPTIVARHAQAVAELPPPFLAMAKAEGDVAPHARGNVGQRTVFEKAGRRMNGRVQQGILGVNVIERRAESFGCDERIGAHPNQMRGIEIGADKRTHRRAQLQQRRHVVEALIAVQL